MTPATGTEVVIPSDLAEGQRVRDDIEAALTAAGFGDRDLFAIRLALEEAIVTTERFEVTIKDEGPGFNPAELPDPTAPENLERPCGRGVFLIRNLMTEVEYKERGNVLMMSKLRNGISE